MADSVCDRPLCAGQATAAVAMHPDEGGVTLSDLTPDPPLGVLVLCERHIASLSVPSGWEIVDQRTEPPPHTGLSELFGPDTTDTDLPEPDGPMLRRAFGRRANGSDS